MLPVLPAHKPPPRCQSCPHTKAGGQHEGRALSCPSPQEEEQTPPPATPPAPQPTGVPGAQKPCEQQPGWAASSSVRPPWGCINAWSPAEKVDTVSGQASQGGRSSSAARARLPSAAGTGRPDSWAGGSAHNACSQAGGRKEAGVGRLAAPPQETVLRGRLGQGSGGTGTQLPAGGRGGRRPGQGPSRLATFT